MAAVTFSKPTANSPTTGNKSKRPNLERQALLFTVGLYLFICVTLLVVHYAVPDTPPQSGGSSSTSPHRP